MKHFIIAHFICTNDFRIFPTTDKGRDLANHFTNRGGKFTFPNEYWANSAASAMDQVIESHAPWLPFKETGYGLS